MSDVAAPAAPSSLRPSASDLADAKSNTAPLKAFESALLNVKASSPPAAQPAVAAVASTPSSLATARSERNSPSAPGKDASTAKADNAGPRPASATTTALTAGVQGNVAAEMSAKSAQKTKSEAAPPQARTNDGMPGVRSANTGATGLSAKTETSPGDTDSSQIDALGPTVALSSALSKGTQPDVKAALQTTLQGFADRSVPYAIKASLSRTGTPASAEIADLLDNISVIAKDILDRGPLTDLDLSNLEQLFWVSDWFDLFNQTGPAMGSIGSSVSSALAMPIDIFYTRALLVPLVDAERNAAPGLVNRRAVRANTEPTPGDIQVQSSGAAASAI
jgi:hypothetical protein